MKASEIREMNSGEIEKFLEEKRTKAVNLRFDIVSKQVKNNKEYRSVKRDIARAMTIIEESKKESKK